MSQPLFPTGADRAHGNLLLDIMLAAARQRVHAGSVVPTFDRTMFAAALAKFDFAAPRSLGPTLDWVIEQMETGLTHIDHPRYFGLFNPSPSYPAQCADRIAEAFNPQLATATTSPAAVAIEAHVIAVVAKRMGLPDQTKGHFTSGGSEANATALLLALTHAEPGFAAKGARAFAGQPVFYISADSHLAWIKIAHQVGIGRDAARLIATDSMGRMDPIALTTAIAEDRRALHVPVMIVATAGTTAAGMIDPIFHCVGIAAWEKIWLHVDAAWGGGVIASDTVPWRSLFNGLERADSVTVDAHKWFATTMGCGMILTSQPGLLAATFHVSTGYMPSNQTDLDPYVTTLQWSRRFLGLRLFLSLATAGWEGHGAHVDRTLALAAQFRDVITALGWRVVNQSALGVICVVPPDPSTVPAVVSRVLAAGHAWVAQAQFQGRATIRVCVTSGETTESDIERLIACLRLSASEGTQA